MKTQTILFVNLCYIISMYLLVFNLVEAGDNATQKLVRRCRENDRRALMEFKANLVDDFGILSSWGNNEEKECCNWRGIRCSNRTGHVIALSIPGYLSDNSDSPQAWVGLMGKVSPSLSELKHLKYLNLSTNEFYGEIPPQLGNLTNLRSLDLRVNYNLEAENLDWLSHLHLLTHLDLSYLNLANSNSNGWLNQVFELSSLTHLHLRGCSLPEYDPSLLVNSSSFSALNSLAMIDFSYNNFASPRSYNWLFNFTTTTLSYFDLSYNSFPSSEIPEAFGRMISLESLFLSSCNFEGMIPDSFMNLSRLATLDMADNNFNGSLSKFLHPLATKENNSIQVLKLDRNQLDGSLRDFFPSFSTLREMSISSNKLSGSFPDSFVQLSSSLVHLDLSYNQITGQLLNLTLFSSLETLALANNKLEGTIPETYLSNLSKLNHLDLSFNSLSSKFSFDWVPPFQLDRILLHNFSLGPQFPNWIKSQRSFSVLDISNAGISDRIPLWFWDHLPPILRYLSLSNNDIQGILPNLSLKFNAAYSVRLDMRSNRLSGPIPPIPVNLATLDLSQNMFSGPLSFLCTTPYKILERIDLSDNQLSGELPDCFMNVPYLSILILANNNLSGTIPTSITLLYQLQALQLRNNNFNGELPSSLKNCTELALLDLSENEFSGEVPKWIGNDLSILVVFSLRKNEFSGTLPAEICNLTHARVLDFSQNKFSGNIPNCINNIDSLVERDTYETDSDEELQNGAYNKLSQYTTYYLNAVVQWKGVASEYRNTLALLKLIDLSSNRLVGGIPKEFSSLKELIALNLSGNNLTGNIIQEIGEMKLLEVLDLSRNQLTGEIPRSLASLTLLSVLDLSMNNLTGRIPTSTQLQSFDASKYAGNEQLCGLPLPNKCGCVVSSPAGDDKEDDDDRLSIIGLYATVILGFVSGFWVFIGPIMLRRFRRHGYNRLLDKIADHIYVTTALYMDRLQRKIYG